MRFLLDADDDWIEVSRRWLYPRLHPYLTKFGGYGVGHVGYNQFVGTTGVDEEVIEEELVQQGAERNFLACFKSLPDGRMSEGSWRFTHDSRPNLVESGMQVHVTMFERDDSEPGRDLFAHYEDDWMANASAHLAGTNFSAEGGVERMHEILADTFIEVGRE